MALPSSLAKYLLGKVNKMLLFFSNEGWIFFFLLPFVALPLYLAEVRHLIFNIFCKVFKFIIVTTDFVNVNLNIADLAFLLPNGLDIPVKAGSFPFSFILPIEYSPHMSGKLSFEFIDLPRPTLGKIYY
jgi:hypothetical protein